MMRSSWPETACLITLCLLAGCGQKKSLAEKKTGTRITFEARSVTSAPPDSAVASVSEAAYNSVNPATALLLRACASGKGWCADPANQLNQVFARASAPGKAEANLHVWYESGMAGGAGKYENSALPGETAVLGAFQPLALVNRMDLAAWTRGTRACPASGGATDGQVWHGAELRFVYGVGPPKGTAPPADYTMIVEFVLPDLCWGEFRDLAQAWQSGNVDQALRLSKYTESREARIRVLLRKANWEFYQWTFRDGLLGGLEKLTDQLDRAAITGAKPEYLAMWNPATAEWKPLPGDPNTVRRIETPVSLQPVVARFPRSVQGLAIPSGITPNERVRNVIALQQCTLCHDVETQANFHHVRNRAAGADAELSKFLTGEQLDVPLSELAGKVSRVCVNYCSDAGNGVACPGSTPDSQKCAAGKVASVTREFHDLARRRLFLAGVLESQPVYQPGAEAPIMAHSGVGYVH
jgi:hypothetical protein